MYMSLFDDIGGRPYLTKVVKRFYDKVYAHPWLKLYFQSTPQTHIENQQIDFMQGALGGERVYRGRSPKDAHPHILATEELYELRYQLLFESLREENAPPELIERWQAIEDAFKAVIIKTSLSECQGRFKTDEILAFENPLKKAA